MALYYLIDTNTNGSLVGILDFLSLICIFLGIYTIICKNPVVSVLFLIGLFSSIATYLILIGLTFIGISYLLVYIGAVSILFLFILMLINIRISELLSNNNNYLPLAILSIISFIYILGQIIPINTKFDNMNKEYTILEEIHFASGSSWDLNLVDITHIQSIGNIMYSSYSIWLIITSIILLLGMVGSIVITVKYRDVS